MTPQDKDAVTKWVVIGGLVVVGLFVMMSLIHHIFGPSNKPVAPPASTRPAPVPRDPCLSRVEDAAEEYVRASASIPSSVDFGWMGWPRAKQVEGSNEYVFSGSVDAKNAFGVKMTYYIVGKANCNGGAVTNLSVSVQAR